MQSEALSAHRATRQCETFVQVFSASSAHLVVSSLWQLVHAFGTLRESVSDGVMKRKYGCEH